MSEKIKGGFDYVMKQLPAAALVFLAFYVSDAKWSDTVKEAVNSQKEYSERLSACMEKLSAEVVQVHAHLDARTGGGN